MLPDNMLIFVKGVDKTSTIQSYRELDDGKIEIVYSADSEKVYQYTRRNVKMLKDPKVITLEKRIALKDGSPLSGAVALQIFDNDNCRILYKNGYRETVARSEIKIIESLLENPKSKNCFDYLKQLAKLTGLMVGGRNILADRYNKIEFLREDCVLASYFSGKITEDNITAPSSIVYPFGFNASQKKAVENALNHSVSVIEGPPGTGKTQTILNIIANAVMNGKSVAVVSGNNTATDNVFEKLKKYGVDFIAASLGNMENKTNFIEHQEKTLPDMHSWLENEPSEWELRREEQELDQKLALRNELSQRQAEKTQLEKEYEHFSDYYRSLPMKGAMPILPKKATAAKLLSFVAELEVLSRKNGRIGFFKRLMLRFTYGLKKTRVLSNNIDVFVAYCQNEYYLRRMREIDICISEMESILAKFDFALHMKHYSEMSMARFRGKIAKKYEKYSERHVYAQDDLWKNSSLFIKDYPVILSTTYSLRSSLSYHFVYDYVIVDEASQVDIVTGALALSCARNAVIVGDLKQLPNVVNGEQKKETDQVFSQFGLPEEYRYANHSLLSFTTELFPQVPRVLLREHYRCHPEIIGFCNQRFYNNELIILTEPRTERQPLTVYRTAPGNHARDHVNQRQIDVIQTEVIPQQKLCLTDDSVGIVTPYRNQADELQKVFAKERVKADTADKFQGQERSVMIFSTVDNEIGDFASNPNRLNVAVSRAIDQFIVVTDGNDNDPTSPIHELIGYIQYHNHEIISSKVYSVFDYLYKNYAEARYEMMKKYGAVSDYDSENLMYGVIREVLCSDEFTKYGVVMHLPLRMILCDLTKLCREELMFATNHLTHVDFLIFSKLTHQPVLVVEVDGFAYHNNEKQRKRDGVKDAILQKYEIPILRLSTVGSGEKEKLRDALGRVGTV